MPTCRFFTNDLLKGSRGVSIRVSMAQHFGKRSQQDQHVEPNTPVVDVPEIEVDTLLHELDLLGPASTALNLRPTGYSGFDVMPERVFRQQIAVVAVMGERMRARADQRHVAKQNIEELRQLIDAGGPQYSAEPTDPRIMSRCLGYIVAVFQHRHGA